MLTLLKYRNLGSPNIFYFLITEINNRGVNLGLSEKEIKQITYNKIIDERSIYDGCVPLALELGVLYERDSRFLIAKDFIKHLNNKQLFSDEFAKRIIKHFINKEEFISIFKNNVFYYDIVNKLTLIAKNAFSLKYTIYKQLLIDFEILLINSDILKGYVINNKYKSYFQKLHSSVRINRRNISVDEFKRSLENKERYGQEAEEFVFSFEEKRLNKNKEIEWLSRYVVNAGFDIVSYDNEMDINHNRFIEVKSYAGQFPSFYWSKNEIKEAKRRMNSYWIYLVDRNKILDENYTPIMINNPFKTIFNCDKWRKSIENYWFQKI